MTTNGNTSGIRNILVQIIGLMLMMKSQDQAVVLNKQLLLWISTRHITKRFSINDKYSVLLFIKQGSNAETYRVKGTDGKLFFEIILKHLKLHRSAFDSDNNLLEIELF